jgi:hypothetical protein
VLFVSGYAEDGINQQGVLRGTAAFLQTPSIFETLGRMIREILDGPAPCASAFRPEAR